MPSLELKAPQLARTNSEPTPQSPNLESNLEKGEYRHSTDTGPTFPPRAKVQGRSSYGEKDDSAEVDHGTKTNDGAKTDDATNIGDGAKRDDGARRDNDAKRDDGAEAMYSSCDEDFPFEEKVEAVMHQTRFRRNRKRSMDSNSTRSYRRPFRRSAVSQEVVPQGPLIRNPSQLRCLFSRWICLFLPLAPTAVALDYGFGPNPTLRQSIATFVVSAIAIPPLTLTLSHATEEITLRLGETLGAVVSLVFSRPALLLLGSFALFRDLLDVVKALVCGAIILNILLVQGACFFFGGVHRSEQFFNITVVQRVSQNLVLSLGMILLPSIFASLSPSSGDVIGLSHATAIVSLILYIATLVFKLKTHRCSGYSRQVATSVSNRSLDSTASDDELPTLHVETAIIAVVFSSLLLGLCSKSFIDSSVLLIETESISPTFFGFVILPLIASSASHAAPITVAIKDKMDLAIGYVMGLSLDIALLILPLLTIMSWIAQPAGSASSSMTLNFDGFQSLTLFGSALLVIDIIKDGKSDWLHGCFLISAYILVAICMWYHDLK